MQTKQLKTTTPTDTAIIMRFLARDISGAYRFNLNYADYATCQEIVQKYTTTKNQLTRKERQRLLHFQKENEPLPTKEPLL